MLQIKLGFTAVKNAVNVNVNLKNKLGLTIARQLYDKFYDAVPNHPIHNAAVIRGRCRSKRNTFHSDRNQNRNRIPRCLSCPN